jgi:hypothetical protein
MQRCEGLQHAWPLNDKATRYELRAFKGPPSLKTGGCPNFVANFANVVEAFS